MHEITPWRQVDCALSVRVDRLTDRESYSREINDKYGEGGGLNANYTTIDAALTVASLLAANGLRKGVHWIFKTGSGEVVQFDFYDKETKEMARQILLKNHALP